MATPHIPASLHKYFPPERVDFLETHEVAFSPLDTFNDPFEGRPNVQGLTSEEDLLESLFDHFPSAIEEQYGRLPEEQRKLIPLDLFRAQMELMAKAHLPKEAAAFQSMLAGVAKQVPDRMLKLMGALCLCETKDSLLMWAHYAKSHAGFVVEFDTQTPFFNRRRSEQDEHYHLRRVLYRSRRPSGHLVDFDGSDLFLVKSDDWSYEKEWRMLVPLSAADRQLTVGDQLVHLFRVPLESVKSITVGARASDRLRAAVHAFVQTRPAQHVAVYRASPSSTHFMLDFEKVAI